jgi:hypothetical protein
MARRRREEKLRAVNCLSSGASMLHIQLSPLLYDSKEQKKRDKMNKKMNAKSERQEREELTKRESSISKAARGAKQRVQAVAAVVGGEDRECVGELLMVVADGDVPLGAAGPRGYLADQLSRRSGDGWFEKRLGKRGVDESKKAKRRVRRNEIEAVDSDQRVGSGSGWRKRRDNDRRENLKVVTGNSQAI